MSKTLSIRTDEALREALVKKAAGCGKTLSEVAREILENALRERPVAARAGHLKGRLKLASRPESAWRRELRERNWRP